MNRKMGMTKMIDSSRLISTIINFLLMEITGYIDDFARWVFRPRFINREDNEEVVEHEWTFDANGRPNPYIGKPKTYLN